MYWSIGMLVKIAGLGKPAIGIPWPYIFMKFSGTGGGTILFYFGKGSIFGWGGSGMGTLVFGGRILGAIFNG